MKKKIIAVVAVVLILAIAVVGTYAYLTDSKSVTNTFTVGKVEITLDEAKVDANGAKDTAATERVVENSYKLVPGRILDKDPTVHVIKGSEACWLFVKVDNQITGIEDSNHTIDAQIIDNGWTALGTDYPGVYYMSQASLVEAAADVDHIVFEKVYIAGSVTGDTLATYAGKTIKVTAYAIQAEGFDSASAAWTAGGFGTTTTNG